MRSFKLFESQKFINSLKKKIIYALIIINVINVIFRDLLINVA